MCYTHARGGTFTLRLFITSYIHEREMADSTQTQFQVPVPKPRPRRNSRPGSVTTVHVQQTSTDTVAAKQRVRLANSEGDKNGI